MRNFSQRKGYVAGWNFHKQRGCGWLRLPSETNHLIKKKWADRIDAHHFQCGDTSLQRGQQPVNTTATKLQIKRRRRQPVGDQLMNYFKPSARLTENIVKVQEEKLHHRCWTPVNAEIMIMAHGVDAAVDNIHHRSMRLIFKRPKRKKTSTQTAWWITLKMVKNSLLQNTFQQKEEFLNTKTSKYRQSGRLKTDI